MRPDNAPPKIEPKENPTNEDENMILREREWIEKTYFDIRKEERERLERQLLR